MPTNVVRHIGFSKIRLKGISSVLRVFGDHMMAHKRPSLSSTENFRQFAT